MTLSAHARAQAEAWGTDPHGWAEFAEGHNEPLFLAVLDAAGVGAGTRLLDVGCGTGRALVLARERGAQVSGLDVAEPLLDVARQRLPEANLVNGEMDVLPFPDRSFDAVIGVNAFQFAADPRAALSEAARVLLPQGRAVASLFAEPERSESTVVHRSLSSLTPPAAGSAAHAPYLLSQPGNLETALEAAGLELVNAGEMACDWVYPDVDAAVRGLLASAGGARAAAAAGRNTAADAIREAVRPFTQENGEVRMRNLFRWVKARKPGGETTP